MLAFHRIATLTIAASCFAAAEVGGQTVPAAGDSSAAPRRAARRAASGAACRVEGVWELVSIAENGTDRPLTGYRQRKMVARGHFMWVGEAARRDTLPLRTAADSLRAAQFAGGAGTYTTAGNRYTERLEYFVDPRMSGQLLEFTCRTEGDRWYHDRTYPADPATAGSQSVRVAEVWRRVR